MKTRVFVLILILVLAVLIIVGSCATGKKAVKAPIESLYGAWANPDYNTSPQVSKLIFRPDGTFIDYSHTDISMHHGPYEYTIPESWIDSDGNKYYKMEFIILGKDHWHDLLRINEADTVLEMMLFNIEYPSEIDPNHINYCIYSRQ